MALSMFFSRGTPVDVYDGYFDVLCLIMTHHLHFVVVAADKVAVWEEVVA